MARGWPPASASAVPIVVQAAEIVADDRSEHECAGGAGLVAAEARQLAGPQAARLVPGGDCLQRGGQLAARPG